MPLINIRLMLNLHIILHRSLLDKNQKLKIHKTLLIDKEEIWLDLHNQEGYKIKLKVMNLLIKLLVEFHR
jgi:hypothetical protein